MPISDPEGRDWVVEHFRTTTAPLVIDLGAGAGTYSDLMRGWRPETWWLAVEIWQPYIDNYDLRRKYDAVLACDVRDLHFPPTPFVLIAGDVLEHMPRSDAIDILQRAQEHAEAIMVSLPVIDYPQHTHDGNPYEEHLDQWRYDDMLDVLGPDTAGWRGDVLGRFWWHAQSS